MKNVCTHPVIYESFLQFLVLLNLNHEHFDMLQARFFVSLNTNMKSAKCFACFTSCYSCLYTRFTILVWVRIYVGSKTDSFLYLKSIVYSQTYEQRPAAGPRGISHCRQGGLGLY